MVARSAASGSPSAAGWAASRRPAPTSSWTAAAATPSSAARTQLFASAAERLEANPDDLESTGGDVRVKGSPEKAVPFRRLAGMSTGFGALYPPIIGRGGLRPRHHGPALHP